MINHKTPECTGYWKISGRKISDACIVCNTCGMILLLWGDLSKKKDIEDEALIENQCGMLLIALTRQGSDYLNKKLPKGHQDA